MKISCEHSVHNKRVTTIRASRLVSVSYNILYMNNHKGRRRCLRIATRDDYFILRVGQNRWTGIGMGELVASDHLSITMTTLHNASISNSRQSRRCHADAIHCNCNFASFAYDLRLAPLRWFGLCSFRVFYAHFASRLLYVYSRVCRSHYIYLKRANIDARGSGQIIRWRLSVKHLGTIKIPMTQNGVCGLLAAAPAGLTDKREKLWTARWHPRPAPATLLSTVPCPHYENIYDSIII